MKTSDTLDEDGLTAIMETDDIDTPKSKNSKTSFQSEFSFQFLRVYRYCLRELM